MFTGLVRGIGKIAKMTPLGNQGVRFDIALPSGFALPADGDSVACSGVCLTAQACNERQFAVDVSPETLSCSKLEHWREGERIHLEPSLTAGDFMGGHVVLGHVDTIATITNLAQEGEFMQMQISVPLSFAPYLAPKGSLALDGVSLTINHVELNEEDVRADFMLIPATLKETTLGTAQAGGLLNMEIDPLARYAIHALRHLKEEPSP